MYRNFGTEFRWLLFFPLMYLAATLYSSARDRAALQTIAAAIPLIDSYLEQHGTFPISLSSITLLQTSVFGVFPPPDLEYTADATHYRLQYYHYPFGPFHGYDSASRTLRY